MKDAGRGTLGCSEDSELDVERPNLSTLETRSTWGTFPTCPSKVELAS